MASAGKGEVSMLDMDLEDVVRSGRDRRGRSAQQRRESRDGGATAPTKSSAGGTKVYVGNLPWEVDWKQLKDRFRPVGDVKHADIAVGSNGRSKGYGIVEFTNAADAQRAIRELDGTSMDDRTIEVRLDRQGGDQAPRGLGASAGLGGGRGAGPGGAIIGSRRVFVGNLAYGVSWQDLKDAFRRVGEVVHTDVLKERSGRSKGCGIVEFANASQAQRAIREMHDTVIDGRPIFVREDREDKETKPAAGGGSGSGGRSAGPPGGRGAGPGGAIIGSRRVFVGNLDYGVSWQDLKDAFRRVGEVVHTDVLKERSGRSKGCGIVEFANASQAQRAIREMQDVPIAGRAGISRPIFVREDREDSEMPRGSDRGGGGGGGGGGGQPSRHIVFRNLAWNVTQEELQNEVSRNVRGLERLEVPLDRRGRPSGIALLTFDRVEDARRCIEEYDRAVINERAVEVDFDRKA